MSNIKVSDEVWERLNTLKKRGESFEDVIKRILDDFKAIEEES